MAHPTDDRRFRLPTHVRPVAHDATLSLDVDGKRFTGSMRLDLALAQPDAEIVLHANGLDLSRARLRAAGREVDAEVHLAPASETVVLRFGSPVPRGSATLDLAWSGKVTEGLRGLYPAGGGILATQFEAADARRVFPCFDEPGFKAPWRLAVEVPKGIEVLSNGPPVREEDLGARRRVHFAETPPLPSYLVALVAGRVASHPAMTVRKVPVRTFAQPEKLPLTGFGQDVAVEVLPRLEDYFG
ncbi:MAG TPA: M1 family peptidase, partial [Anaeromyxobacter sp.]